MEDGCFAQFAGGPENRRLTLNSEAAERFGGFFWRLVEMRSVGSRPIRVSSFLLASISTWDFSTRYLASFFSAAFGGWRTLAPVTEELAPTFCWFCEQLLPELLTQVPLHGDGLRSVGEKSPLHSLTRSECPQRASCVKFRAPDAQTLSADFYCWVTRFSPQCRQ